MTEGKRINAIEAFEMWFKSLSDDDRAFYIGFVKKLKNIPTILGVYHELEGDHQNLRYRAIHDELIRRNPPKDLSEHDNETRAYYEAEICPWCGAQLDEEVGNFRCPRCGYDHNAEKNCYDWNIDGL